MAGDVQHVQVIHQAGYTGTLKVFDSQASTLTVAATDLVRPDDFNVPHNFFATISGNTAGAASTASGTNLVWAGGPFHTLSMAVAGGAATITFSGNNQVATLQRYTDFGNEAATSIAVGLTTGSASFRVLQIPENLSFTRVDVPVFVTPNTTSKSSSAGPSITSVFVLYTRDVNNSLNPIVGQSAATAYSWISNTTGSMTGGKYVSFNIATSLTPGEYFCGFQIRTATSFQIARTLSISLSGMSVVNASSFTDFGVTASASTNSFFAGVHTNTITATNQTIAMSDISVTGTANYAANFPVIFRNY